MAERIASVGLGFEREKLQAPFGFKGAHMDELWQIVVLLQDENGNEGIGLGVQSVLWSDSSVFAEFSPAAGNSIMLLLTERALSLLKDQRVRDPMAMLEDILPEVLEYGKKLPETKISGRPSFTMPWSPWIWRYGGFTRRKTGSPCLTT